VRGARRSLCAELGGIKGDAWARDESDGCSFVGRAFVLRMWVELEGLRIGVSRVRLRSRRGGEGVPDHFSR
jgi:hypothetical protein